MDPTVFQNPDDIPCGPATSEAPEGESIDVNDLADCVKIIDMCSERGAFKGNELKGVGELRDRLVNFVNAVVAARGEEESVDEDDTNTETETTEESE
jgi:hypothetical protein